MYKKYIGASMITLLAIVPLILWYPSVTDFTLRSMSQIFALTGLILFSVNFVLSTRIRFIENIFGGLNNVYIIHHLTGIAALILLLFHPVVLGYYYLKISVQAAFNILFPALPSGFATWFGTTAILTLIALMILTIYIKLPYQLWKFTHKFMGIALVFASIHIYFIDSTVSTNIPLRIYILGFCSLGLLSYLYRTILGRFLVRHYKYKVKNIDITNNVTTIILEPTTKILKHRPGQFIFVKFKSLGITKEEHPFSLTSIETDGTLSISAKSSGDYTETLKLIKKGSEAEIEGPFGRFSYLEVRRKKQIWIAGGIGITPFLSMARNFSGDNGYDAILYYVVHDKNEAIFLNNLVAVGNYCDNFSMIKHFSTEKGHLSADDIAKHIPDFLERDILICGPPPMMKSLRQQFNKLGMRNSHIITEEFSIN